MVSYVSPGRSVTERHPRRAIQALAALDAEHEARKLRTGRPWPPGVPAAFPG